MRVHVAPHHLVSWFPTLALGLLEHMIGIKPPARTLDIQGLVAPSLSVVAQSRQPSPSPSQGASVAAFFYDLNNLATDHPNLSSVMFELYSSCWAHQVSKFAGNTIALKIRTRRSNMGRFKNGTLDVIMHAGSTRQAAAAAARGIQTNPLLENAAIAYSAAAMYAVDELEINEVTLRGDCGDYWLFKNGAPAGLCEISGTDTGNLQHRYTVKRKQVRANNTTGACYVSVIRFASNEARFCRVR